MRALCLGLLCCAFTAPMIRSADGDAAKKDLAALDGEWTMVSGKSNGTDLTAEMVKSTKRTFKDGVATVEIDGQVFMKAKISLGTKDKLKTIDFDFTEGRMKGKKGYGIYEINGDEIKFCNAAPDAERPTSFESKEGSNITVTVWKKVKAEKK